MAPVDVFRTEKGSIYQYNEDTGLWGRKSHPEDGAVYVGSVDSSVNEAFEGDWYSPECLNYQLTHGAVDGFVPRFVEGNRPLGFIGPTIPWALQEVRLEDGQPSLEKSWSIPRYHIAHRIVEIYREVDPSAEMQEHLQRNGMPVWSTSSASR